MRRGRRPLGACAAIAVGTVILLYVLLPGPVWWVLFALGMIAVGLWLLRCC